MRKKIISVLLALVLMLSAFCTVSSALTVSVTSSNILIDGEKVDFQAYLIDGNNYFKLRDLAYALSGTDAQFEVTWNQKTQAINVIDGQSYTPVGGELVKKNIKNPKPVLTTSIIYSESIALPLRAYNIADNNYFKLREVAEVFDFAVEWDNDAQTVRIDTSKPYTPPAETMSVPNINSYYMLLIGKEKADIDALFGTPTKSYNSIYLYPGSGFHAAYGITAGEDAQPTDKLTYISSSFDKLVNSCPSAMSLNQIKNLFGNAEVVYSEMDSDYFVNIQWAGFGIVVASDSKGNVKNDASWYVNADNVPSEMGAALKGKWSWNNYSSIDWVKEYNDKSYSDAYKKIGDGLDITIEAAADDFVVIKNLDFTTIYGPYNIRGQEYDYIRLDYCAGPYIAFTQDSWGNNVELLMYLNDNGNLVFKAIPTQLSDYASYAFSGEWILSK